MSLASHDRQPTDSVEPGAQVLYSIPAWRLAGQKPAAAFWQSGTSGASGPCQLIMQLVGSLSSLVRIGRRQNGSASVPCN